MPLSNLRATLRACKGKCTLDTFELNKIAGGILLCLLVVMGLKNFSEIIFEVPEPATPGYDVSSLAVEETPAGGEARVNLGACDPCGAKGH